jgi:hypothetical protein
MRLVPGLDGSLVSQKLSGTHWRELPERKLGFYAKWLINCQQKTAEYKQQLHLAP